MLGAAAILISCSKSDDAKTAELNKDGTVEVIFNTRHLNDSFDILTTTKNVYKQGNMVKAIVTNDTLPSLGKSTAEGTNDDGETKSVDMKKEYNMFVTIK